MPAGIGVLEAPVGSECPGGLGDSDALSRSHCEAGRQQSRQMQEQTSGRVFLSAEYHECND